MEAPLSIFWGVVLVGVLVGINAFFVAAEYALVRVRRTQMEAMAAQGSNTATVRGTTLLRTRGPRRPAFERPARASTTRRSGRAARSWCGAA